MSAETRVLIVDDEPANVRVLAETLRDRYALSFARSGAQAVELARSLPIDLVLLDVIMPGMDGFAVLEQLRSLPATADVPVIFVTALDELDDEARGLEQGAVDYITKPINPPIVRARVRTHVELKRQRDLLANLANVDGLTGIANRRRLDELFDRRWERYRSSGEAVGLLLVDIDHFKQFNDTHGHAEGDECLKRVASEIAQVAETADALAARYGGEEFANLCGAWDVDRLAAAVCAAVRDLAMPHGASSAGEMVTVSVGGARSDEADSGDAAMFFERADRRLYRAKEQGRNRVETGDSGT
ncbi:MAG: diguanylate cyclase [Pseudomonadota bacterium]